MSAVQLVAGCWALAVLGQVGGALMWRECAWGKGVAGLAWADEALEEQGC